MNGIELEALLAKVQGYDNRELTEDGARAWAEQLARVPYAYAAQAVAEHFREEPDKWIGPGHVLRRAKAIYEREQRAVAVHTRQAAEDRSEEIRRAALERKAADLGTTVVTPDEAERYGKGLLNAVMRAVAAVPRDRAGRVPRGHGVAAANRALADYRAQHGPAPLVDGRRQPCGNPMCACTHEDPCQGGWVPIDSADPAAAVEPCRICKPKASAIVENARGNRAAAGTLLREQGKKDDGKSDEW